MAFDTFTFGFSIQFCFAGRRAGTLPLRGDLRLELLLKNNFYEKLPEIFFVKQFFGCLTKLFYTILSSD